MNIHIIVSLVVSNYVMGIVATEKIETWKKQSNETCGGVFTEISFFLQSPNYPQEYPPNLNCVYVLKGPNCPTYYEFDFIDFQLENSVGCVKDRLLIENQDALCGKVGVKGNKGYFKSNGSLNVKFETNNNTVSRGFKIFVTRMPCESGENEEKSTIELTETIVPTTIRSESTTTSFQPFRLPISNTEGNYPQCCLNTFNSKRFLITSPNFPYSLNTRQQCSIRIQKFNQNICRLRLSFLFFWLGSYNNNNNCPYGYIKVDDKFICGCNKELKLITTFDENEAEHLVFKSEGIHLNYQSGFVIEVIQEECSSDYYPVGNRKTFYVDERVKKRTVNNSAKSASIEQTQLVNRPQILNRNSFEYNHDPRLISSYYIMAQPDNNTLIINPHGANEIPDIVTDTNQLKCNNWNKVQIEDLVKQYGSSFQTCKKTEECRTKNREKDSWSNCIELNHLRGNFRSPGYPFFYPKMLNMCFRFRKQPGYCAIRLYMNDFQLQGSYGCRKDYVLLGNQQRYCGRSLLGQYITFDLTSKDYEDLRFVTDFFFCGRGFCGTYEQLPCQPPTVPINPTTIPPSPTPNAVGCDRYITDQSFTLELKQNKANCIFDIRKFSKSACKVVFQFERFDLYCGSESLLLGNITLCGHLTDRKISVNFDDYDEIVTVAYRSNLSNKYGDFKFKISGQQVTDDCLIPEPPAQLISSKRFN